MTDNPTKIKYLLDTNILIDFALWIPINLKFNGDFWNKLEETLQNGDWILLDVVINEIKYPTELKAWCQKMKQKGLVTKFTDDTKIRSIEINNTYEMIDSITSKSTVDTYLIAYAEANKLCIFSRESPRKLGDKLYKIPDVCDELKIQKIKRPEVFLKQIGFQ